MRSECAAAVSERIAAPRASVGLNRVGIGLAFLGGVLCLIALFAAPDRIGFAYLWGFSLLWTVVLGSLFFVGLQHVTGSIWSVVIRRVAEMFAAPMWLVGVLFVPMLLFVFLPDTYNVFPWAGEGARDDHLLHEKSAYLNVPFFIARALVFFTLWIVFARYYLRTSLAQDRGHGGEEATLRMRRWSAPFMLIFGVTATFASFDWLMSLDPYWFSTIFGVYVFSGMVLASLACITVGTVTMRDTGRIPADAVTNEHLYSLGALLFAFTCFWAYIAFSQYMLIWYANIPEETSYLHRRVTGSWLNVSIALAIVRFALPFLLLLSRHAKMNPRLLFWASILILIGQILDLYWLVMPERDKLAGPGLGWQELGPLLLVVGVLLWCVSRFLGRHAPVAVGDPVLGRSLEFRL